MILESRIVTDISSLAQADWDELDHEDNPFLSLGFLCALEISAAVCPETGWQAHHLAVYEDGKLVAFAPGYLKSHSHGEFVFDWAWADAYHRYGRDYYPKLLTAVPYSPVTGPRLLVRRNAPNSQQLRTRLALLAVAECERLSLSSWHCNFISENDYACLSQQDLLPRSDWQFHWANQGYQDFDEFLQTLRSRKRKNIKRDRRLVVDAGIRFEHKTGAQLSTGDLEFIYTCYQETFLEHGNHPALNRKFFSLLVQTVPDQVLAVIASREDRAIAMSFFLVGGERLYGRYWGCLETIPGLHFETAYHQGIEYCIKHGIKVFEPGAQGEHKISRGFLPVKTRSFHHVSDPVFRQAITDHLLKEQQWTEQYRHRLDELDPYRSDPE